MFSSGKVMKTVTVVVFTITAAVLGLTLFVPQRVEAGTPSTFTCCDCNNANCAQVLTRVEARGYCYERWAGTTPLGGICKDKHGREICRLCP